MTEFFVNKAPAPIEIHNKRWLLLHLQKQQFVNRHLSLNMVISPLKMIPKSTTPDISKKNSYTVLEDQWLRVDDTAENIGISHERV